SLEVSLQLDKLWVAGREPTTADPCLDPAVLCTDNELQATIDWPTIAIDKPWRWSTGGAEQADLELTGTFDLSTSPDAKPTTAATVAQCHPPAMESLRPTGASPGDALAQVHGGIDLSVIAGLVGSDALDRAEGRIDIDLSLSGPAADATVSGRITLPDAAAGAAAEILRIDLGSDNLSMEVDELDLRIDDHWIATEGRVRVMGEPLHFGSVRGDHTGFAFGGPCAGHWGVALDGTIGSRIINQVAGEGTASRGAIQVPKLVALGHLDATDPIDELSGSVRLGRDTITLELDDGLPGVELTAGRVDFERCFAAHCPPEIEGGSVALYVGGREGAGSDSRPTEAVRAKIGPRGTAFGWGTAYIAPDFQRLDGTEVVLQLEDVPYRGYDQRGRPVYETEMSSPAVTFEGGTPLVVSGDIDLDRTRYVQDAVQGVEILRFTDDVDLPSAPPPEIIRNLQFDLRVETRSPLRVENNVAHGVEADAVMDVTGTYDAPEFTGRVDVEPGGTVDIPFLTGTYEIQRGRVTVLRELGDAEVDVLALRQELVYIDDQPRQVYLLLGGTADAITWQCIAEGDTSGAVETQRGCLNYLVLGAGDVQTSNLTVQRTGGGGLANARKPLQVVGHVTEFDLGRRIVEAEPRFGQYVPDIRLRLGQIGPELEIATPAQWLDFDYVTGTAALDYTRGYPGFLLQQSRELTFKLEAIDMLVLEISRDIRSYLNNRIIFDPLRQTTVEFRVDFEIPSLR
ncbi:MAG: translocation/assembly module TamB domain-containing protein, partial [Deltaproteobacteria bacterium]|nr:translocation/assembly module TamB domain-containing protein [Deltaproteobacteria bacterium]